MTSGQDTWSARCVETRTAGAAGGPGKPTGSDPGRAPRSDPTGAFYRSELYPLLRAHQRLPDAVAHEEVQAAADLEESHPGRWTDAAVTRPRYFAHWAWVKPARQVTRTTRAV